MDKFCVNCKHHVKVYKNMLSRSLDGCDRDKKIDVVDGESVYYNCATERGNEGAARCGQAGKFFEEGQHQ